MFARFSDALTPYVSGAANALSLSSAPAAPSAPDPQESMSLEQIVEQQLLVHCGSDSESRPVLAFFACRMPNPAQHDHDALLQLILSRLKTFVENDYTLIVFNAAARHQPGFMWMMRAYNALDRNYRKNIKALYVVHPSMWIKFLMDFLKNVISEKFAKKLHYVDTLSALALKISLAQVPLPDEVIIQNRQVDPQFDVATSLGESSVQSLSQPAGPRFFGVDLAQLCPAEENTPIQPPALFLLLIEHVRQNSLEVEGLFRRSPSSLELQEAKSALDRGQTNFDLSKGGPHVAAVLLKIWLRDLPEPLIPQQLHATLENLDSSTPEEEAVSRIKQLVQQLPAANRVTLFALIVLLAQVAAQSNRNLMTANNLAIVFAPNLIRSPSAKTDFSRMSASTALVRWMIQQRESIFD